MEKWRDLKELFLLPLNWHGDGDDVNDDDSDDIGDANTAVDDDEGKKSVATKKPTKSKHTDDLDDDSEPDSLLEDVDGLSAQELRDLLRTQNNELKKERIKSRKRLREIMEKKEKFKEIEAQKEKELHEELEKKKEFEKLYLTIKPKYDILTKDVGKTHTYFEKRLVKLTDDLPEEYHGLIPDVDVRNKIAWIENFKATVIAKQKTDANVSTVDDEKSKAKKKADTQVGNSGNPKEDPDKDQGDDKSSIEAAINNCKSPDELERLLAGLAKKGL